MSNYVCNILNITYGLNYIITKTRLCNLFKHLYLIRVVVLKIQNVKMIIEIIKIHFKIIIVL